MNIPNNSLTKILAIVISLILLACCWQAIKMGKANLSFYVTHQLTEQWQNNSELIDINQFNQALMAITDANTLHPTNPHYLITQGLVYEWGATSSIGVMPESPSISQLKLAEEYYLAAVSLRPTWPVTWATLAILKWRLGEIDQQLIDYLKQADKYGPNTVEVHQAWLEVGFYLYQSKSVYSAQIVKGLREHLELMLTSPHYKNSAIAIIKRHNVKRIACLWMKNYDKEVSWSFKKVCVD